MVASKSNDSSLPPPYPRSPPQFPDLYGKRRELARVQMLQREIGFLDVSFFLNKVEIAKFFILFLLICNYALLDGGIRD